MLHGYELMVCNYQGEANIQSVIFHHIFYFKNYSAEFRAQSVLLTGRSKW